MTNESKNDQNNIVPDVPLERRSKKRKEKESQRRVLNDRRIESINVTNDRRKGPRRSFEKENGGEISTDWLQEAIQDAKEREGSTPAMTPPAVNIDENAYIERTEKQRMATDRFFDLSIIIFVVLCSISLIVLLITGD